MTMRRRSGKSRETTGRPTARLSNSLLGVDRRSLRVRGWLGITPTSAHATQSASSSGGTAGRTWTLPPSANAFSPLALPKPAPSEK